MVKGVFFQKVIAITFLREYDIPARYTPGMRMWHFLMSHSTTQLNCVWHNNRIDADRMFHCAPSRWQAMAGGHGLRAKRNPALKRSALDQLSPAQFFPVCRN
jgi:hypothetical protein